MNVLKSKLENARRPIKEAAPLPQKDNWGCLSACAANLLHMYGVSDAQDTELLEEVDRLVGRSQGEPARPRKVWKAMAQAGLSVVSVTEYDTTAFIERGVDYNREFYDFPPDDPAWERLLNRKLVRDIQKIAQGEVEELAPYQHRITEVRAEPVVDTYKLAVERGA